MRNRMKTATPTVRTYIDENADEVTLSNEVNTPPVEPEQPQVDDMDDDSWLDDLTPYEVAQPQQAQNTPAPQAQQDDSGTEEQQQRLADLYANFEHIDEDVAAELDSKMFAPLRNEINELKALRQQEQQRKQNELLANANNKIIAKHPKAEKILRSQQFKDFVNADNDPYSADQAFDRVMRAYYAGDGDYVVRQLDAFVGSRGKPKPPVGAEPHQGSGGSSVGNVSATRPMTEAEYLAKRQAIKAAPRGTYPPNALKQLAEQYQLSRG